MMVVAAFMVSGLASTMEPMASTPPEDAELAMVSSILLRRYWRVVRLAVLLQYTILSNHAFHCPTICHRATVALTGLERGMILPVSWLVAGAVAMALAFAVVLPMLIRSGRVETLPLCGGVLFILLYVKDGLQCRGVRKEHRLPNFSFHV